MDTNKTADLPGRSGTSRAIDAAVDAANTILERGKTHGDALEQNSLVAAYWGLYLGRDLTCADVCVMMDLLKLSRIQTGQRQELDHWRDRIGYAAIAAAAAKELEGAA